MSDLEAEEESSFTLFKKSKKKKKKKTKKVKQIVDQQQHKEEIITDVSFEALHLSKWLISSVNSLGMRYPTPIQMNCIRPSLDTNTNIVIGSAPTGSGKTAAFALPILEKLSIEPYGIYALILTPTRELAMQIADQFKSIGSPISVNCAVVIGGLSILEQSLALSNQPHIVVATPGRLADHLLSDEFIKSIKFDKLKFLVLDECDRLLDDREANNLTSDIKKVCSNLPNEHNRQTFFYTATFNDLKGIDFINKYAKNVCFTNDDVSNLKIFEWHSSTVKTTVDTLKEEYVLVPEQIKHAYLAYIIRHYGPEESNDLIETGIVISKKKKKENKEIAKQRKNILNPENNVTIRKRPKSMILFTSTIKSCQLITELLKELGVHCVAMHSQMPQAKRIDAIDKFKVGYIKLLVATDVASRGLDIPKVDLVLNYDVPRQPDNYIHRVGRTARIGRKGYAITLVTQFDVDLIKAIEKITEKPMTEIDPKVDDDDVTLLLGKTTKGLLNAKLKLASNGFIERNEEIAERKRKNYKRQKV